MTQMNRPRGAQRVHVLQRVAQGVPVKEGYRVEGLILGAGGYVPFQGQFNQKPFQLLLAEQRAGHFRQRHVMPQPENRQHI